MRWMSGLGILGLLVAGALMGQTPTPVVVELFTSEGCSSCPPADEQLLRLQRDQPVPGANIIPLSFHVDYWDYLGWRDPFSSHAHTERQQAYNRALRDRSSYTPQMVVDGAVGIVGSNGTAAEKAVEDAARRTHISVDLQRSGAGLKVAIPAMKDAVEVLLIITENNLASSVVRGENAGRRLRHAAVVRRLKVVARLKVGQAFQAELPLDLPPESRRDQLQAVVLVQEPASRRILGASAIQL